MPEQLRMAGSRVMREGVALEVNAYCRRANAKAVDLAGSDGEVVLFTMGPPSAEDALREMIACGADRAVHLCDWAFAGSDTLATAVALAAALKREGPFDLVLAGLNSLDADTGQVPAEVAELLGLPFAAGVRDMEIVTGTGEFTARLEVDDGYRTVTGELPAVLSAAERLCYPSKAPPEQREAVPADRISRLSAADLGLPDGKVGESGSPTSVGPVRSFEIARRPRRAASTSEAVDLLVRLGALAPGGGRAADPLPTAVADARSPGDARSPADARSPGDGVWCFFTETAVGTELLGAAADLARRIGGTVTAVTAHCDDRGAQTEFAALGAAGADRVLVIPSPRPGRLSEPAEQADALAAAAAAELPWALLVEGTASGRSVASAVAARHGWGLVGDAVGLEVGADDRLIAWKPAFSGRLQAPIRSRSPVQMVTVRPGVLSGSAARPGRPPPEVSVLPMPTPARLRTVSTSRDETDPGELRRSKAVVALGQGVDPSGYPVVRELCAALGGAALGATRKVTDRGWLPRGRQIGVTGHFVAPRLLGGGGFERAFQSHRGHPQRSGDPRRELR